jgi:hypothetical protein
MGARLYYLSEALFSSGLERLLAMCTARLLTIFCIYKLKEEAHVTLPMSASHAVRLRLVALSGTMVMLMHIPAKHIVAYLYFFDTTCHATSLASCIFRTLPLLWLLAWLLLRYTMNMPSGCMSRRVVRGRRDVSVRGGGAVKRRLGCIQSRVRYVFLLLTMPCFPP